MKKVKSTIITFGLIAGAIYFLFFIMMYFMIDNPLKEKRDPFILQLIIIFYSVWLYKKKQAGYLHFYEGISIGILGNLLAALLSGILLWVFIEWVDIKPFETWITESKVFLIEDRPNKLDVMSDEQFDLLLKSLDKTTPVSIILDRIMYSFWGILFILPYAIVMRKVKPLDS